MKTTTSFSRLSKADQRRAICRDALAQLRAKRYVAETGSFIKLMTPDTVTSKTSLRRLLARRVCNTCALGSILASQVRVNGDCKLGQQQFNQYDTIYQISPVRPVVPAGKHMLFSAFIKRYFSVAQLQLIEIAFERGRGAFKVARYYSTAFESTLYDETKRLSDLAITSDQAEAATVFGRLYSDPTDRLRAILKQIIRSKEAVFTP